jgi:glycerol-3-phosphate dehydrogenase (NAD(P)+)
MQRVTVVGAGAWGTALAAVIRATGRTVTLWAREAEVAAAINAGHENEAFLPGIALDPEIRATPDLAAAQRGAMLVVLATPAQFVRDTARRLAPEIAPAVPVLLAAKGIEQASGALMTEVLVEALPGAPVAVLSGPTFAAEVARGLPTAVTVASADPALAERIAQRLGSARFRPYVSADPVGVEIGGAVKNVIAIACGIVSGRGLGENARAALITRGLAEIVRLALAKGGRRETLMGLAGLGDLTLTCNALQSRNFSLGAALGAGKSLSGVLAERRSVAEGVATAPAVVALARRLGIDMPIAEAVDAILHRGAAIDEAIRALLARPFKPE